MKLQNKDKLLLPILASACLLLGIIAGGLYANREPLKSTFLQIKATDVAGLLLTLLIGLLLTLWANKYLNFDSKRRELLLSLIVGLEKTLTTIYSQTQSFISSSTPENRKKIYKSFRTANQTLSLIQIVVAESHIVSDDFITVTRTLQLEYRTAITDGAFASTNPSLDTTYEKGVNDAYDKIMAELVKKKVSLFS